ncbi:ribosome small subunit-dependent GTPase A [Brevibacterium sp. 5221]|uniref:Small ribosomal subunit biogenesis GTPase RsgA n=1 Tax=Brevibacterium rongguiense TaxID=2695267 RepID=A0A6N9H5S7_9MICO|nr:ribosome small subunit-dependent GTPase A [Brevibacterium rongguiense]MYM19430.1 ribosome small subunit-dependent GTPase A [Brevibacterium rongguiense]
MSPRYRDFTEDDYRPRPNRRGSRPRTKERPAYESAVTGMITAVDRGRYRAVVLDGAEDRTVAGVRAARLRRTALVPGDRVDLVGDTSGAEGSLARIVGLQPRCTVLRRSADDADETERVIVANADQLVIVTATADPAPSEGLIDRAMAAAFDAGIEPLLAVTKLDLAPLDDIVERFGATGIDIVPCGLGPDGRVRTEELRPRLEHRLSVLLGHSGVGKSTLMNALLPQAARATGAVNDVTGRGRHTSSSALALPVGADGWVVDTPGVRSFGLAHVDPDSVVAAFADLVPATADCPKGCTHLADSPGCALDAWVAQGRAGEAGPARLASLRRLLAGLRG